MQWSIPSLMASRTPPAVAALTLGTFVQKSGNGNALPVSSLTSVPAGSVLIAMSAIGIGGGTLSVTSSPSLTWTRQADCPDTSCEIHTAVFTAGGSIDITPAWDDATNAYSLCGWVSGNESTPGGASKVVLRTDPPFSGEGSQGDITTTRAGSIIFGLVGDRADITGTITYIGTPTELFSQQTSVPFCYFYYKLATSIATYTLGLSSPNTGAAMGQVMYEIRTP